jgi:hypothetical protein
MIAAIFDRSWVHPWRRPAEAASVVRLSAPAEPAKPEWERIAEEIIDACPDLVRESEHRAELAAAVCTAAFSASTAPADINVPGEGSRTSGWPDPYGPDKTVFGDWRPA